MPKLGSGSVGASLHREDVLLRQQIVHHREDGLFDFARILRATDKHQLRAKVEHDEHFRTRAVYFGDSVKVRRVNDGELRNVRREFIGRSLNEQSGAAV